MHDQQLNEGDLVDSPEAFGYWLEANREHLLLILQQKASPKLRSKVDADDLLQDAASRAVKSVVGMKLAMPEVMPWFLQILTHTIIDAHRHHFGSQKRDAAREFSVDANLPNQHDQAGSLPTFWPQASPAPAKLFRNTSDSAACRKLSVNCPRTLVKPSTGVSWRVCLARRLPHA